MLMRFYCYHQAEFRIKASLYDALLTLLLHWPTFCNLHGMRQEWKGSFSISVPLLETFSPDGFVSYHSV